MELTYNNAPVVLIYAGVSLAVPLLSPTVLQNRRRHLLRIRRNDEAGWPGMDEIDKRTDWLKKAELYEDRAIRFVLVDATTAYIRLKGLRHPVFCEGMHGTDDGEGFTVSDVKWDLANRYVDFFHGGCEELFVKLWAVKPEEMKTVLDTLNNLEFEDHRGRSKRIMISDALFEKYYSSRFFL